ncbi:class I SAM-dependent methyltransferase [Patescibacteria group bacterium]
MENKSTRKHWQQYWQTSDHQPMVVHEELINNIQKTIDVKNKKILEIGAGMAGDSIFLSKSGADITILDFTNEALKKASDNAKKEGVKIKTIKADARSIPAGDNTYDIIFHQGFLEHFKNPDRLLEEQYRVLKKGGILVVDVPQKYTTYTIKKHLKMLTGKWFAGWEKEFSVGELEKLLVKNRFKLLKSYGWGYFGKLNNIRHLRLGKWYEKMWKRIESSRVHLYLSWCIGVVVQK